MVEDPKAAITATLERYSATDDLIVKALKGGATSSEEVVASQFSKIDDPTEIDLLISNVEVHLEKLASEKTVKQLKSGWKVR